MSDKQFDLIEVIQWVGGAFTAAVLGTWTLVTHLQSNELASYKAAEAWKPLETITELRDASKSLNLAATERNELIALRTDRAKLLDQAQQISQLVEERNRLSRALATMTQESLDVNVTEGSTEYLIPNLLLLGVLRVYKSSNQCEFNLRNRRDSLKVGNEIEVNFANSNYFLRLTEVTDKNCRFAFVKSP